MIDTKLGKFGIWSLFIVIILTFGLRLFYFGTFFLIKRVDPTIFCRHASDNMQMIFIFQQRLKKQEFFLTLMKKLMDFRKLLIVVLFLQIIMNFDCF